jgi:amidase
LIKHFGAYVDQELFLEPSSSGHLLGRTFAVKDIFAIRGENSGAGNPDWLRTHSPSGQNASVIDTLLSHGARLEGTTHTDELMFSLSGQNDHYGTPVNPATPDRIPGGSSSGSAVAVAAGLSDFALGTDTGGSIRVPSSHCGIFGFRPTHGAVSMDGVIPLAPSFDTVGWFAADAATMLQVGSALLLDTGNHNGFNHLYMEQDAWSLADTHMREDLKPTISLLTGLIQNHDNVRVSRDGLVEWMNLFRKLQGIEIWSTHGEWIQNEKPIFGKATAERFAWAASLNTEEYELHTFLRGALASALVEKLGDDGVLIIPTTPGLAPLLNASDAEVADWRLRTLQLTSIAGLTGLPQLSIPIASAYGPPIGLSIIAGRGQDLKLLSWINEIQHQLPLFHSTSSSSTAK